MQISTYVINTFIISILAIELEAWISTFFSLSLPNQAKWKPALVFPEEASEFDFFTPPYFSLMELKLESVLGYAKKNEAYNEQKMYSYLFSFIILT